MSAFLQLVAAETPLKGMHTPLHQEVGKLDGLYYADCEREMVHHPHQGLMSRGDDGKHWSGDPHTWFIENFILELSTFASAVSLIALSFSAGLLLRAILGPGEWDAARGISRERHSKLVCFNNSELLASIGEGESRNGRGNICNSPGDTGLQCVRDLTISWKT